MDSITPKRDWREVVSEKRALREAALKPYLVDDLESRKPRIDHVADRSRISPEALQEITEIGDISILEEQIQNAKMTAEDVTLAYIKRATVAHQLTNCLTEIFFAQALQEARELDRFFKETGKTKGPLHGIPITLKDQFSLKGYDTTLGYVGRAFKPATEDSVLVTILRQLGAVIIAKSNLPQSIMWCETDNPLWGLTTNPRNPDFTSGGSTGGESALLALHASIVGFGTDIGGSVRIPQNMMGGYGLKPSSTRFPYQGVPVSTEGQEHVPSSIGVMTRTFPSILSITQAITNASPWTLDPRCAPLAWRPSLYQEPSTRPLVIGIMPDDGVVRVHPPIARHLRELATKLKAAGHHLIHWQPTLHAEAVAVLDKYYTSDGGEDIKRDVAAGGEPFIPHVEALVNRGTPISVYEYWQLNREKLAVQKAYLDKWNSEEKEVDVLLTPTMPHVAVPHRGCKWVGYTKVWNVLDYPAMTFEVGVVDGERDGMTEEERAYRPRNELDSWNWKLYDLESMKGHPVSLQVVGRRLEEEKVLGAVEVIEKVWRS